MQSILIPNQIFGRHTSKWCGGGNNHKDGGEDVDGEKHQQISYGLAGTQRVSEEDSI